ncbi:MAG: deoxyribonuclease IV [Gemmatimonadales bacterium]
MPRGSSQAALPKRGPAELLGAHVSTSGGVQNAPERGTRIGATAIQLFTKPPSQWREPTPSAETVRAFRDNLRISKLRMVISHDSYLINLATPDPQLSERSIRAFVAELRRCRALGIRFLVSHPGNYIDERREGLIRNARNYSRCLRRVPRVALMIENTAGSGTALGSRFEELAELRDRIAPEVRNRVGFCLDTCHLHSSGYDLVSAYDSVWEQWERTVGLKRLWCLHLNDSKTPFASFRDRHELIGEGTLGANPFRRIMNDPRFRETPKIIETPKGKDEVATDRRMLGRLRRYRDRKEERARSSLEGC